MQEWKWAMDREMESLGSNSVWSLVEAPREVKHIESKLIYKKRALVNHVFIKYSRYNGSLPHSLHKWHPVNWRQFESVVRHKGLLEIAFLYERLG